MDKPDIEKVKAEADKYREILLGLSDSPESISSIISMLCLSDLQMRDALLKDGMTPDMLAEVKKRIEHIYRKFLDKNPPDLSWMDKVEFKFLKNTETSYTIPLPATS